MVTGQPNDRNLTSTQRLLLWVHTNAHHINNIYNLIEALVIRCTILNGFFPSIKFKKLRRSEWKKHLQDWRFLHNRQLGFYYIHTVSVFSLFEATLWDFFLFSDVAVVVISKLWCKMITFDTHYTIWINNELNWNFLTLNEPIFC